MKLLMATMVTGWVFGFSCFAIGAVGMVFFPAYSLSLWWLVVPILVALATGGSFYRNVPFL